GIRLIRKAGTREKVATTRIQFPHFASCVSLSSFRFPRSAFQIPAFRRAMATTGAAGGGSIKLGARRWEMGCVIAYRGVLTSDALAICDPHSEFQSVTAGVFEILEN